MLQGYESSNNIQLHLIFTDNWPTNKYRTTDVAFKLKLQKHNGTLSTHGRLEMEIQEKLCVYS